MEGRTMACPVCGSPYFWTQAHDNDTVNECHVCHSEWTDHWDTHGERTGQTVTKNTREPEQSPEETGDQPTGEPSLA
jgi:hypothetical protein